MRSGRLLAFFLSVALFVSFAPSARAARTPLPGQRDPARSTSVSESAFAPRAPSRNAKLLPCHYDNSFSDRRAHGGHPAVLVGACPKRVCYALSFRACEESRFAKAFVMRRSAEIPRKLGMTIGAGTPLFGCRLVGRVERVATANGTVVCRYDCDIIVHSIPLNHSAFPILADAARDNRSPNISPESGSISHPGNVFILVVLVQPDPHDPAHCHCDPFYYLDPLGLAAYFFGGTGNSLERNITNVEILYQAWEDSGGQGKRFYVSGVFSGYTPSGRRYRVFRKRYISEGAFGRTLGDRVSEMMDRLTEQLEAGDTEVNVFGFSRGSTAAIEFLNQIQDRQDEPLFQNVNINFVALWDTVKSTAHDYRVELPGNMKFKHKPLHFIAIDEQRKDFSDSEVLNVRGALQIGYRGVHADVGGYEYSDKFNEFGKFSRDDAVYAANLIGIRFNQSVLDQYFSPRNWRAIPTDNRRFIYRNRMGHREFPEDMYIHWSVPIFNLNTLPPYNPIHGHKTINYGHWRRWAGKESTP